MYCTTKIALQLVQSCRKVSKKYNNYQKRYGTCSKPNHMKYDYFGSKYVQCKWLTLFAIYLQNEENCGCQCAIFQWCIIHENRTCRFQENALVTERFAEYLYLNKSIKFRSIHSSYIMDRAESPIRGDTSDSAQHLLLGRVSFSTI